MGFFFGIEHANLVAYLTGRADRQAPRLTAADLDQFLVGMTEWGALVSSEAAWIEHIRRLAEDASERVRGGGYRVWDEPVPDNVLHEVLAELQAQFRSYQLYALMIGGQDDEQQLSGLAHFLAVNTRHRALILMPRAEQFRPFPLEVLDPQPVIQQVAENSDNWPGVLFWVQSGEAAFVPVDDVPRVYALLQQAFDAGDARLERVLRDYNDALAARQRRRRILHLSDLHFGTRYARDNETYLVTHLESVVGSIDRVVITGDLFDNPRDDDYRAFERFRYTLRRMTHQEPVVVPGNHDQRVFGNSFGALGRFYRQLADVRLQPVVVDDAIGCAFFCFNSSELGDAAQGGISTRQLRDVATEYETLRLARADLGDYLRIAVTHHHPYSFDDRLEKPIQRWSFRLRGNERLVRMVEAERFVNWCAARDVPLVMHGHKHVPRHIVGWGEARPGVGREVAAVGCGASLGVEGRPLSYNILSWRPHTRKWVAEFFSDSAGGGFAPDYTVVHSTAVAA